MSAHPNSLVESKLLVVVLVSVERVQDDIMIYKLGTDLSI